MHAGLHDDLGRQACHFVIDSGRRSRSSDPLLPRRIAQLPRERTLKPGPHEPCRHGAFGTLNAGSPTTSVRPKRPPSFPVLARLPAIAGTRKVTRRSPC